MPMEGQKDIYKVSHTHLLERNIILDKVGAHKNNMEMASHPILIKQSAYKKITSKGDPQKFPTS